MGRPRETVVKGCAGVQEGAPALGPHRVGLTVCAHVPDSVKCVCLTLVDCLDRRSLCVRDRLIYQTQLHARGDFSWDRRAPRGTSRTTADDEDRGFRHDRRNAGVGRACLRCGRAGEHVVVGPMAGGSVPRCLLRSGATKPPTKTRRPTSMPTPAKKRAPPYLLGERVTGARERCDPQRRC